MLFWSIVFIIKENLIEKKKEGQDGGRKVERETGGMANKSTRI